MSLYRFSRQLHAWAGLVFALFILLVSLSGTLLVWKEAYLRLTIEEARQQFQLTPDSMATIIEQAQTGFEEQPLLIQFARQGRALNKLFLGDGQYAYTDIEGNLIDRWSGNGRPEEWLYDFHHRLLLDNTGVILLGSLALMMIPFTLLGLFAFWPFRKTYAKQFLPNKLNRSQLILAHRNLGATLALPLLLIFLTGAILAFPKQAQKWLVEPAQDTELYQEQLIDRLDDLSGEKQAEWHAILQRTLHMYPGAQIRSVRPESLFSNYRVVALQQPGDWHQNGTTRIYFDAFEGYMDINIDAHRLPLAERLYLTNYPLHTGNTGSLFYKWFSTFLGLSLSCLAMTGVYCYLKRLRSN